jgi:hypothetical protein
MWDYIILIAGLNYGCDMTTDDTRHERLDISIVNAKAKLYLYCILLVWSQMLRGGTCMVDCRVTWNRKVIVENESVNERCVACISRNLGTTQ